MNVRVNGREGMAVEWNPLRTPSEVIVRYGVGEFDSVPISKVEPVDGDRDALHEFLERGDPYGVPRPPRAGV